MGNRAERGVDKFNRYDRKKYTLPIGEIEVTDDHVFMHDKVDQYRADFSLLEKLPEWIRNFRTNLETIGFDETIADLPDINGPAVVVDHQMTGSAERLIPKLRDFKGTVFVTDRTLYKILPYRVPEYVGNIDSSYLCMSFFDRPDVRPYMDKVTAIFATTTFTLTIRHWHGRRVFFTPWIGPGITESLAALSKTPWCFTGGNIATLLWILAVNLNANPIALVGIDNAVYKKEQTEYPGVPHRRVKGPYGTVLVDPVYDWYAEWHLSAIRYVKEKYGITTVNVTKGGLMYSDYIEDMSIDEFIKKYNK